MFGTASSSRGPSRGLQDGDSVAIVGGGPAGAFFAIHLLREARRMNCRLDVVIVEKRGLADLATDCFQCRGCSFCAGGISPRLHQILERYNLAVPEEIIQGSFDYVWIQGQWKNFRLRVPPDMRMYSVFRGALPSRRPGRPAGFDGFLLGEAVKEGARVICAEVQSIDRSDSGMPLLALHTSQDENVSLEASFVTIATGINAHCGSDYRNDSFVASIRRMSPDFVPGRSRRALIFELDVGEEYLQRNLRREIYFVEYGSKQLQLDHAALIPKGAFLTVAILGQCIEDAASARDRQRVMQEFLELPQIRRILPGIATTPVACACAPRMTVTTAKSPYGDRFAVIGDAVGARLNKDGLFSAHLTALRLAETILHEGVDRRALAYGYGQAVRWLAADNRYGRIVFSLSRVAFNRPLLGRITYQAFANEYKVRDEASRPLTAVLWKIASGTADYREVLGEMLSLRVLGSVLVGAVITLRNVALELLFGLEWGDYGRYPTVVLKEKREGVKDQLAASLGEQLPAAPDYERMYVIKIRGSAEETMDELAHFGLPGSRFLNLRFVEVRQIRGVPNEAGSVICYRLGGVRAELQLAQRIGNETLLYRLDERFADGGQLIFSIAPAKDGNSRLAIYAAFDFKRGTGFFSRIFWACARALFPGFVHDVVWNHALCSIKEEVERAHDRGPVAQLVS